MFQIVECCNINTSLYRNIAGAKFSDVMERQRIDMGSQQIGIQIRNQKAVELPQEFQMASTLYRMAESLNDNEEINNQFKLLKTISKKRNEYFDACKCDD